MALAPAGELVLLNERLMATASRLQDASFADPARALLDAAKAVERSWSGSPLGYHALVYYQGFRTPPPGAHFSADWGLHEARATTGSWYECTEAEVIGHIELLAGQPDIASLEGEAAVARTVVRDAQDDAMSLLRAQLGRADDQHLRSIADEIRAMSSSPDASCCRPHEPAEPPLSRDSLATSQGIRTAPHQDVVERVQAIEAPFRAAADLAVLCRHAARHLARVGADANPEPARIRGEGKVVIGHGRSLSWLELKDFVADRLALDWDEFNRVSVAGVATADRLLQMLQFAGIAILVATADDEGPNETQRARQNVVHEIGLFQGRLGFTRAIVLLEDGCEDFSNIHGIGHIRFPRGEIRACFEEVRRALEREGFLP